MMGAAETRLADGGCLEQVNKNNIRTHNKNNIRTYNKNNIRTVNIFVLLYLLKGSIVGFSMAEKEGEDGDEKQINVQKLQISCELQNQLDYAIQISIHNKFVRFSIRNKLK